MAVRAYIATIPLNGQPIFLGSSPGLQYQADEEVAAVASAAVQAARYVQLSGRITLRSTSSGGFSLVREEISLFDDEDLVAKAAEEIEIIDTLDLNNGMLVRCVYPSARRVAADAPRVRDAMGRPNWLGKVPEIPGMLVGVGTASRKRLLTDSIEEADKSAMAELLSQLSILMQSDSGERALAGYGSVTRRDNYQIAQGTLSGYYVLDRWISDDGETFYSLAICPIQSR